jgi:hypothetical protein
MERFPGGGIAARCFLREIAGGEGHNPILPRFRSYNLGSRLYHFVVRNSLSSSPLDAAYLIAQVRPGICRGGQGNGTVGEGAAAGFATLPGADDIAHRLSISVRHPGRQRSPSLFGARTLSVAASRKTAVCSEPVASNHFPIRPEDPPRTDQKPQGVAYEYRQRARTGGAPPCNGRRSVR